MAALAEIEVLVFVALNDLAEEYGQLNHRYPLASIIVTKQKNKYNHVQI